MNDLALLHKWQGKYEQAGLLHKQVLSIREQAVGNRTSRHSRKFAQSGVRLLLQGRYEQAEPLYVRANLDLRAAPGSRPPRHSEEPARLGTPLLRAGQVRAGGAIVSASNLHP